MPGMSMQVSAVQCLVDLVLEVGIVDLRAPVEVCQLHVDVVDDLSLNWPFGEQDGRAATERLGVNLM